MNLWFLTEEKPKISTLWQILNLYCRDFESEFQSDKKDAKIKPLFSNNKFTFTYLFENVSVSGINNIYIKTVSGSSSFFDFLLFKQEQEPADGCMDNLLMAIEETKTSDDESRNTGVYQRGSKFVHIKSFSKEVKLYMLYNDELGERTEKTPSCTSIFGTNILLTLGVEIVGKSIKGRFRPFASIDELIQFKSNMRKPPAGNVPISITKKGDTIFVSGRLSKPANEGNIGHDPNIGALSMISACIRKLGWCGDIVITMHGVSQKYAKKNRSNKFFHIARALGVKLDDITFETASLPEKYWKYEKNSEKVASILLHIVAEYCDMREVYQNHAGCERGYFKTKSGRLIVLPKKDSGGVLNLYLPDLVLSDVDGLLVLLIEGKQLKTLSAGLNEIKHYDSIENEYINKYYPGAKTERWLSIFGGNKTEIPHEKVLLYLTDCGAIYINDDAPDCVKQAFSKFV
ncbi:MAG: hypothetical protein FWB93_00935 [Oscillospiraceae bacterium]|nr:hypothetical protein [Oscillospiraceae bacterium]